MEGGQCSVLDLPSLILDLLIVSQHTQATAHPLPGPSRLAGIGGADRPRAVLGNDETPGQLAHLLIDIRQALRKGRLVFIRRLSTVASQAARGGTARGRAIEVQNQLARGEPPQPQRGDAALREHDWALEQRADLLARQSRPYASVAPEPA